jgi:hypothetical protein
MEDKDKNNQPFESEENAKGTKSEQGTNGQVHFEEDSSNEGPAAANR